MERYCYAVPDNFDWLKYSGLRFNQAAIQAILLDMDGVLYHGSQPLPYAAKFLQFIHHIPYCFITNNPVLSTQLVIEKLARMGLGRHDAQNVVTSADATAQWLSSQKNDFRYFAVGAAGLHQALRQLGREDKNNADFVVVGEGEGLDFESLSIGINLLLKKGARLVGTNPDTTVDSTRNGKHWIAPGGGALIAPFVAATQITPEIIGKPQPLLYQMALRRLNTSPAEAVMIGDRPDTDILGAQNLGMQTALVRTGRFLPGEPLPENIRPPDWDVADLGELQVMWQD